MHPLFSTLVGRTEEALHSSLVFDNFPQSVIRMPNACGDVCVKRHRSFCTQTGSCLLLETFIQIDGKFLPPDFLESGREEGEHLGKERRSPKELYCPFNSLSKAPCVKYRHLLTLLINECRHDITVMINRLIAAVLLSHVIV